MWFKMKILITGGAGFIGSNLVRLALKSGHSVINLDKLTYAGNLKNLTDIQENPNYLFIHGDIANPAHVERAMDGVDVVMNLAAETHVDRSIDSAAPFVRTNLVGTQALLDAAMRRGVRCFLQVSTDEVYGSIEQGRFDEASPLRPSNPYSASKAGADLLALSYHRTYGLPVVVSRCSNNYGPYQFPEKLIPLMVTNALDGRELPVYGDGLNVRDWIHVEDHCRALLFLIEHGKKGKIYNISASCEKTNIEIIKKILYYTNSKSPICFVKDRPGHDRRYALDSTKIRNLGWKPEHNFDTGLEFTVNWYRTNRKWWKRCANM